MVLIILFKQAFGLLIPLINIRTRLIVCTSIEIDAVSNIRLVLSFSILVYRCTLGITNQIPFLVKIIWLIDEQIEVLASLADVIQESKNGILGFISVKISLYGIKRSCVLCDFYKIDAISHWYNSPSLTLKTPAIELDTGVVMVSQKLTSNLSTRT